jgi:hypothetical protein
MITICLNLDALKTLQNQMNSDIFLKFLKKTEFINLIPSKNKIVLLKKRNNIFENLFQKQN